MDNTLVMYPNLQYNPIKIPDFTVLEIYKDSIATDKGLGYCIIPIEGLTQQQIRDAAKAKADLVQPEGYTNYTLLTGAGDEFNHKIVYGVWYMGEAPTYPDEPSTEVLTPEQPHNIWHEIEVENPSAPSFITVTLTCSALDHVEFYINNDYFAIDIDKPVSGVNDIVINKEGVSYNGKPISNFKMTSAPKLKTGVNYIKVNCVSISKIGIKYRQKY